jgi:hypothetical protein
VHSRIYQITTAPIKPDGYITEADFYDHWFTSSVADYVGDDADRANDLKWFREHLSGIASFDTDDSFIIQPGGKEKYFAKAYDSFIAAREKTMKLGLAEFASGDGFSEAVRHMENAFCEEYSFYVSSDEFDTIPLDDFIRCTEVGTRYYIGGTLDYHF